MKDETEIAAPVCGKICLTLAIILVILNGAYSIGYWTSVMPKWVYPFGAFLPILFLILLTFTIIFAAAGYIRCEKPKLLIIGSLVAVLDFFLGGVIVAALILVFCWLKGLF